MKKVVEELHQRCPDKKFMIAGDNDIWGKYNKEKRLQQSLQKNIILKNFYHNLIIVLKNQHLVIGMIYM